MSDKKDPAVEAAKATLKAHCDKIAAATGKHHAIQVIGCPNGTCGSVVELSEPEDVFGGSLVAVVLLGDGPARGNNN